MTYLNPSTTGSVTSTVKAGATASLTFPARSVAMTEKMIVSPASMVTALIAICLSVDKEAGCLSSSKGRAPAIQVSFSAPVIKES